MPGLDDLTTTLSGGSLALTLALALVLGLRHATDPDHLTAVATLIAGDDRHGWRRARRLGAAWGLGHGMTLFAFGVPVIVVGRGLPERVQQGAEVLVGAVICVLAVRLLMRWHGGAFHAHRHSHGTLRHAHPHAHAHRHPTALHSGRDRAHEHAHDHEHDHDHEDALGRSPLAAFGLGLVHGVGGSGGASILLIGTMADGAGAVVALAVFAAGTACSMALLSAAFGLALVRATIARGLRHVVPAMGMASLLFGVWYSGSAIA